MSNQPAAALRLHVPEPTGRPGHPTDFSYLRLTPAGEMPMPPLDCPASDMRQQAWGLIRVMDHEGRASGPWVPDLSPEQLERGLRSMMKTRIFDATKALGAGAAITTLLQPVKVATITLGSRNYVGLVGSAYNDTAVIVGYVTRLPSAAGGMLQFMSG
ncbi:MAG TPA: hypothetical protein PLB41_13440, partial [Rubrivivax sp.]|nr:hypothetical protein [Rubrivivax sp.]